MKKEILFFLMFYAALTSCTNRQAKIEGGDDLDSLGNYAKDSLGYNPVEYGKDLFGPYLSLQDYPNTPFFHDLVEAYNIGTIHNALRSIEDYNLRWDVDSLSLESLNAADINVITDKELRNKTKQCIDILRLCHSQKNDDPDTLMYGRAMDNLWELDSMICSRFKIDNYTKISENEYYSLFDYSERIKDVIPLIDTKVTKENYSTSEVKINIRTLKEKIAAEKNFERKCDLTQAYIDYVGFDYADFSMLEKLLDDGRYSHRLFFLWRIWRCGIQLTNANYGMSTWSTIPNKLYNEKRFAIAKATLNHLKDHPDDGFAINQFLMTGHYPNILRAGQYLLGNEAVTELYYLGLKK